MSFDLKKHYLRLKRVQGVGDETIAKIYREYGSLTNIYDLSDIELTSLGLKPKQIAAITSDKNHDAEIEKELELLEQHGINLITLENSYYPEDLLEVHSPPPVLYHSGNLEALKKPCIGIVGSRKASRQAKEFTAKIAEDLAEIGFNVVSGLAFGIDIAAHSGSVKKGSTTAVLGSGLMNIYPKEHEKYLGKIKKEGCVISEFELNASPDRTHFPRRNRIISGLCKGIIVVEAQPKSGSLITAKLAAEQGREVFAVPTFPSNHNNMTNQLIKEGAKLVENYLDVIEELNITFSESKNIDKHPANNIVKESSMQNPVFDILLIQAMNIDELCIETGLEMTELIVILSELELLGHVVKDNDGRFRVTGE